MNCAAGNILTTEAKMIKKNLHSRQASMLKTFTLSSVQRCRHRTLSLMYTMHLWFYVMRTTQVKGTPKPKSQRDSPGSAGHGTARHGTARHGTARHGTARHGTARHGTARHGTARHGTARHGTASAQCMTWVQCTSPDQDVLRQPAPEMLNYKEPAPEMLNYKESTLTRVQSSVHEQLVNFNASPSSGIT